MDWVYYVYAFIGTAVATYIYFLHRRINKLKRQWDEMYGRWRESDERLQRGARGEADRWYGPSVLPSTLVPHTGPPLQGLTGAIGLAGQQGLTGAITASGELTPEEVAQFREAWTRMHVGITTSEIRQSLGLPPLGLGMTPIAAAPMPKQQRLTFQEFVESRGVRWIDVSNGQYPFDVLKQEYDELYPSRTKPEPERVLRFDNEEGANRIFRFDDEKA